MDCKPGWINASIVADNLSMEAFSIAVIVSRKIAINASADIFKCKPLQLSLNYE